MATITGTAGADALNATSAVDTITGAGGADRITGTIASFDGDAITDFGTDDLIVISDAAPISGFVEFTGGALVYDATTITLPGLAAGVFVAAPFITGGIGLAYYAPRSIPTAGTATNAALTYGGISLDTPGITFTNTGSGRILYRGVAMNQGGSTFINELGGQVEYLAGSSGNDTVVNRGTIRGDITLAGGNDTFTEQGGPRFGTVYLGSGDDSLNVRGAVSYIAADGGDGDDSLEITVTGGLLNAHNLTNFERATLSAPSNTTLNITNLSGLRQILIDSAGEQGYVNFVDSLNPLADVTVNGGSFSFNGSTFRSVTGSNSSDYIDVSSASIVSNDIALGGGDDTLNFWVSGTRAVGSVGGAVSGGTGTDTLQLSLPFDGQSRSIDLARFTAIEKLFVNASYVTQSAWTINNAGADFTDIRVGSGTGLTLNASTLPTANVDAVFNARLVIAADSLVASIYSINARLFGSPLDTPQGDFGASSQILINGSVTGDIEMGPGDDTVDVRSGTVGGTIFGNGGNDILRTGSGANRLVGGFGNDTLEGGAGNDTLEGGRGFDTAVYSITRAQATITRNANGTFTVASGPEGTDTLSGVERIKFGDTLYLTARFEAAGDAILANFAPGAGGWSSQDRFPRLLADVDGDGRTDIVGFGQAGTLVALHQSDGTFRIAHTGIANFGVAQGWISDNTFHREVADVNGDGRDDVVGFGTFGVQVALAQADGTFAAPTTGSSNFNPVNGWTSQDGFARTVGDVNGDGFADVVGFGIVGTFVALGTSTGTFGPASFALANFGRNQGWNSDAVFHRELGDVNGDGRDDIVGFGAHGTYVALGQANGTFAAPVLALQNFGTGQGWSTQDAFPRDLGDVNGDGRDDIVGFGIAGSFVAYGQANGTFSATTFDLANFGRDQGWTSDNIMHRELADMNGDGTADIIGFGTSGVFVAAAFDGVMI